MANTVLMLDPDLNERLFEMLQERVQDNNRSGFQNLGTANNSFSLTTSASLQINGQGGADTIQLFGTGSDIIHTGSGADFVFAGAGNDRIFGGSQNDTLIGFDGNDTIVGGSGNDTIEGGIGIDDLFGGTGNDVLFGGAGIDIIKGGFGNDELFGDHDGSPTSQQGRDFLSGGAGDDTIHGGGNADTMFGDGGADIFVFDHINDFVLGHSDVIRDFSRTEGDKINLTPVDAARMWGNQNFTFVDGPSTQVGTLWLGTVDEERREQRVFMNIDGGSADFDIIVKFDDDSIASLQSSDFML